jgi:hypothetical protein
MFSASETHLTCEGGEAAILIPETGQVKKNPGLDIASLLPNTVPNSHNGPPN